MGNVEVGKHGSLLCHFTYHVGVFVWIGNTNVCELDIQKLKCVACVYVCVCERERGREGGREGGRGSREGGGMDHQVIPKQSLVCASQVSVLPYNIRQACGWRAYSTCSPTKHKARSCICMHVHTPPTASMLSSETTPAHVDTHQTGNV